MASKFKITTVFDGKNSQKIEVKNSISVNDTELLEKIYEVVDSLSEHVISRPIENNGRGISKDDFVQDTIYMIEDGGKLEIKITII